jgi:hypothetical protein
MGVPNRASEIIIRLTADPTETDPQGPSAIRRYDALVYTNTLIEGLTPVVRPPPGTPTSYAGLPLVSVEEVRIRWRHYHEYLAAFFEGAREPVHIRSRLFETMSVGLEHILSDSRLPATRLRVWFGSNAPELIDLPWEFVAYDGKSDPEGRFSFVRGAPSEQSVPKLPVGEMLRLGVVGWENQPPGLRTALQELGSGFKVVGLPNDPREALATAAREGFEVVHVIADGVVSLAYEGVLRFESTTNHSSLHIDIAPGELASLLSGSRVGVLCLTPKMSLSSTLTLAGNIVPSVFRAFAFLGSAHHRLPTIVAPTGPIADFHLTRFWSTFYQMLNQTLEVERAVNAAQMAGALMPIALFLRQQQHKTFQRTSAGDDLEPNPAELSRALQSSRHLTEQLGALRDVVGELPESVRAFLLEENEHQERLSSQLDPWTSVDEEDEPGMFMGGGPS